MTMTVAPTLTGYEVSPELDSLSMATSLGESVTLSAETLRTACKCAHCLRARFDDRFPLGFPGLAIVEVADLGYGLNIAFSDGHNRGIYPKSYLLDLASL
ncbi:gamma-butyrobetaine hydroxylase-like domain-containing protein [Bradyrhizobium genosp. P]|uniref:gamma-butyrobetaine hydroxylase-like domain-containing protein n=1 Tax=Bradyrhizobium genosp. P TaxID=83641 RepID=UPI003CECA05A